MAARKFPDGQRVKGSENGPASFRGRTGTVFGYGKDGQYIVQFDDGVTEHLYAHWLEAITEEEPGRVVFKIPLSAIER